MQSTLWKETFETFHDNFVELYTFVPVSVTMTMTMTHFPGDKRRCDFIIFLFLNRDLCIYLVLSERLSMHQLYWWRTFSGTGLRSYVCEHFFFEMKQMGKEEAESKP